MTWTKPSVLQVGGCDVRLVGCVVGQPLTITSNMTSAGLAALEACTLTAPVTLDCPLTKTSFRGSTGLDLLRFPAWPDWPVEGPRWHRRRVIADHRRVPAAELEATYRQLRAGLESSRAAPSAADFYVGELEARRRQAERWSLDRWLLPVYRVVGGYGVRAMSPLVSFLITVLATTLLFMVATGWFVRDSFENTIEGYHLDSFWGALAFVLRNSISLFSAPAVGLTPGGTILLIAERFTAVSLLTLTVFAVRSRVAR